MYGSMFLKDYLAQKGIKLSDLDALSAFGKQFMPEVSGYAIRKWARGERSPRAGALRQIEKITDGQVTVAEFMAPEQKAA
jgi:hypothetical protein